jgi:hypothetical protein
MLDKYKNTRKQGDAGLGAAIAFFTSKGLGVAIPLTDSQEYDLIVDDGQLKRVQVKTTTYTVKSGNHMVSLTTKGGNRTGIGKIKKFDPAQVDALFILTPETQYCIPTAAIGGQSTITLSSKYDQYQV